LLIERPHHRNGGHVADDEYVECLLVDFAQHYGQRRVCSKSTSCIRSRVWITHESSIANIPSHDTPSIAFRSCLKWEVLSGVQSWNREPLGAEHECEDDGHGSGSSSELWGLLNTSELSIASLDISPARNMAIPWPMELQYNAHLRPMRSRLNTQMRVENWEG
jgi:hypothetical protein